jgi:hypothetical protein
MLEGLDEVPWDKLTHAYGAASDVPHLLRDLASDDEEAREGAVWHLYGNIWHQGTVYEATASAVPFLLELAAAPEVKQRELILDYLCTLAFGTSYLDVHQHGFLMEEERASPDFDERLQQELSWVRNAHEAVRAGAPVFVRLLDDPEPEVRAGAARALGLFSEDAGRNGARLVAHVEKGEPDDMVHAACVFAAGMLAERSETARAWLHSAFETDGRPAARLCAAIGLARALRAETPVEVVMTIIRALRSPGADGEIFARFPWEGADLETNCSHGLALAGEAAHAASPVLAVAMERISTLDSYQLAQMMLYVAFGDGRVPMGEPFVNLSETQQAAVRAIATSKTYWRGFTKKSIIVDALEPLRRFGLPDGGLDDLRAYVDGKSGS